ncbi:hypothetical protein [Flavobacterium sp.]|uniref:hypothetical protein n=1 Tax=Flavobacterium sp. TaxID=239 RepID=UPI0040488E68
MYLTLGNTFLLILFSFATPIVCLFWMLQMLKLTRQNRIINAMTLKVMLEHLKQQNIDVDIEKIHTEVTKNL